MAAFKKLRLNLEFNPSTAAPEFSVSLGDVSAEVHLAQIIFALDQYCVNQEIKVCLILDEFQEICELKESKKIEALLRGGMQAARNVSFLMMGSRRTILRDMFEDRKRPFYKSTYVLPLSPIPLEEFVAFLIDRYASGGKNLSTHEARELVEYVQAYPYYVQKLAMLHYNIMDEQDALARAKALLVHMEAADFEGIFLGLTNHQKRLLRAIAKHRPTEIHSLSFLVANRLGSQGGVQTSLAKLKKMDVVEKDASGWRVVDPIFEKWLITQ